MYKRNVSLIHREPVYRIHVRKFWSYCVSCIYISYASIVLLCNSTAATPKQWEGLSTVWIPDAGYFTDTVISYDFTNQKLRYFGSMTFFNNSSKPTLHFEELYLYNEVRIEAMV